MISVQKILTDVMHGFEWVCDDDGVEVVRFSAGIDDDVGAIGDHIDAETRTVAVFDIFNSASSICVDIVCLLSAWLVADLHVCAGGMCVFVVSIAHVVCVSPTA